MKTYPIGKLALLLLFHCLVAPGCATRPASESEFIYYYGEQKDWPTDSKAVPAIVDGIPVYRSNPERAYEIIGFSDLSYVDKETVTMTASSFAKKYQGEATIISEVLAMYTINTVSGKSSSSATKPAGKSVITCRNETLVVVIKWK